jgi:demethylspheroidene O-methyltransferase
VNPPSLARGAVGGGVPVLRVPLTWRSRWLGLRNRLFASPRFQRWASSFPLTRPIARRRARALFDLCAGFVYSQILTACIELRLFDLLVERPLPLNDLAQRLGLAPEAALRLLKAAQSLGLVEESGADGYALGDLGAALRGNPGIAEMVSHHGMLYRDLGDPVALLRRGPGGTELGAYWAYAESERPKGLEACSTDAYTALMGDSQGLVAGDILDAYSLARHRRLLDLGGGNGTFLSAVGTRWPNLELRLFDLPPVAEQASRRFERSGMAPRAQATGGDLFRDPLPEGADICSLVRVLHDHDDGPALSILRAARQALPPGGTLLLAEPMSGTRGAEPIGDAYFGLYLWAMGSGRTRTAKEIEAMLREAGFNRIREMRTRRPLLTRLLIASS